MEKISWNTLDHKSWVLLIPATEEWIQESVNEDEDDLVILKSIGYKIPGYAFCTGKGKYNAIVDLNNTGWDGAEATAEKISSLLPGKEVFSLFFDDDFVVENEMITCWVNGKKDRNIKEDPSKFGANMLEISADLSIGIEQTYSVCIIDGATEKEILKAVKNRFPEPDSFTISYNGKYYMIHHKSANVYQLTVRLADDLGDNVTVYGFLNTIENENVTFNANIMKGDSFTGIYEYPVNYPKERFMNEDETVLDDILGETQPERIIAKLSIPKNLLGFA